MKTLITTFHAPKTAGSSSLALNTALAHQFEAPQKGALIQVTPYGDIDLMAGISQRNSWNEVAEFHSTDEWGVDVLSQAAQNQGIDIYQSPSIEEWGDDIEKRFFDFFELIKEVYDFVYIDLGRSVGTDFSQKIIDFSHQTFVVQTLDPSSSRQCQSFIDYYKPSSHGIIINQVSPKELSKI